MSESRKVIGVFDQLVASKNGIAFPAVRAWVRGANDYETAGLEQLFPERGTVYLHVSACENQHPQRNQVGFFECVESVGQRAAWKVTSTLRQLAKVVDWPGCESRPEQLAFWEWVVGYREAMPCNILLSQGIVYVRRGRRELVGPFSTLPEGKLVPRQQTFLYEGLEIVGVDIGAQRYGFIDTEFLPKGKPLLLDPREAIHRRLKLLNRTGQLEWLSRGKVQELSSALAGITVADGSEWVMEDLPRALEVLSSLGAFDEKVADSILQIKSLDNALELAWKKKHAEALKKADGEIEDSKRTVDGISSAIKGLNDELSDLRHERSSLQNKLVELENTIDAAKAEAQKVFDAELRRLAQSPASLALIGAWSSSESKVPDRAVPRIRVQRWGTQRSISPNLVTALASNLKACGLSPTSASEVADVCAATLAAGQPIAFRSLCADLLAEAVAAALGGLSVVWADVPAGLLDSIDWEPLIPAEDKGQPLVIQAANRSDVQLVLGSLRSGVLRRTLGLQKPGDVILLTLESSGDMQVQRDLEFGSLIDDRVLKFTPGKPVAALSGSANYVKEIPEIAPVTEDEFKELGDTISSLTLFQSSAQQFVFRRAYGALRKTVRETTQVGRFFFKYWCLPRISPDEARKILDEHKKVWEGDKVLVELSETLRGE